MIHLLLVPSMFVSSHVQDIQVQTHHLLTLLLGSLLSSCFLCWLSVLLLLDGSAVYLIRDVLFFGDSAESAADGQHFYPAKRIPSNNAFQNQAALAALCDRLTHAGSDKQIVHLVFGHSAPLSRGLAPLVEWSQGFQQQSRRQ